MKISEKQSDKRKAILDASLKLFCEKCFQDTSTASISSAANVGTGTLFCYFESKEDLVNALYLESKEEFASYVEDGVLELVGFKLRLRRIFERMTEWMLENNDKVTFMRQFRSSPLITKMTHEKILMRMNITHEVVKQAAAAGEVEVSSVELLSALISGHFYNASLYMLEHAHSRNLKKWQEDSFNLIWKGIH